MENKGNIVVNGQVYGGGIGLMRPVTITKSQYEALGDVVNTDNVLYCIIDDEPKQNKAEYVKYDNSESGLESDNVQGAIDEINESVDTLNDNLSQLDDRVDSLEKHTIGQRTDLLNTSSTNKFIAPSDGYALIICTTDLGSTTMLYIGNSNITIGGGKGRFATFVKKGTSLWVNEQQALPTVASFIPLL